MSKRKKDPQVSLVNQVEERRSELVEKLDHPLIAPGVAEDRPSIRCRVSWQSMGNHAGGLSCDWSLK